jgi:hypothetical protein
MATSALFPGSTVHGGTAIGARPDSERHRLGNALHAVRVFAVAIVDVVILGNGGKKF